MDKIRYAIIGCGRIAPNHLSACIQHGDLFELAAVCDIVPENMEWCLSKVSLADAVKRALPRYADYRKMLEEQKIDLIAVATESGKHFEIAAYCLKMGCHVIVEKPVALSLEHADKLIVLAKEHHRVLCACHQNRFNKSIAKIREAIEQGRFGRLLHGAAHIRWNRGEEYYRQAPWRGTWDQDGGALMNQCIHNIDLLRWMMGDDITEVFAYTDRLIHPYIEAEDLGLALLRFRNGAYGLIEGTTNVYPRNLEETLLIFGERGTVKAGGISVNRIEEWSFADSLDQAEEVKRLFAENPPNVYGYGHSPLYRDVGLAIREGRSPKIDGEAGKRALEVVLAIYKSAKEGRPVRLPLESFSAEEMKGMFQDGSKG